LFDTLSLHDALPILPDPPSMPLPGQENLTAPAPVLPERSPLDETR
jgi:hypothetical protein